MIRVTIRFARLCGAVPLLLLVALRAACAHESRPAYLEIKESAPGQFSVLWRTPVLAGMRLPVALKLPEGVRNLKAPTVDELADSLVERRSIDAGPEGLSGKRIELVGLQMTITDALVRVEMADGRAFTTVVHPSQPWVEIAVSQGTLAVAAAYVGHGIEQILFGADHLLLLLGLVLVVRDRWLLLLKTVTAFAVAHSLTLALATLGLVTAPGLPLNAAIALGVLFLGAEVVRSWRGGTSLAIEKPWIAGFAFGLLNGLGFAGAIAGAQLPRSDLLIALVGFNAGIELGLIGFVLLIAALERALRPLLRPLPGWASLLPGYAVGSLGAFWVIERSAALLGMAR